MNETRAEVLVVGAGPAGLATAASLAAEGVRFELVDAHGTAGGAYARAYGPMELASPARYNALPGLAIEPAGEYMSVAEYAAYLARYAAHHRLEPRRARLRAVAPAGSTFETTFDETAATSSYRFVVVATGMFDFPKTARIEGLESSTLETCHVARWPGAAAFRGRRLLIVGAATSAVEIAEECGRAGIPVTLAARGARVKRFPQRVLGRDIHDYLVRLERLPRFTMRSFCAGSESLPGTEMGFADFQRRGLIRIRDRVARVDARTVTFVDGAREDFDAAVLATGYRYETDFLPDAVARAAVSRQPLADANESRSWPGLFVMGMPCARGLASPFLRGIAQDAPRVAGRIRRRLEASHAH
ncbi:hypothetical protein BWI17_14005 [Betaproteobacteria bacterium GR16-43]|nr:hypothetical protein BWI17_14005 [Betaproteobacteria bacterium GR16-43]